MPRYTLHEHFMSALPIQFAVLCAIAWNRLNPYATGDEAFAALFPAIVFGFLFTWVVSAIIAYSRREEYL